jgi:hypothetical protein
MRSATLALLMLSGCASAQDVHGARFDAILAPFCVFNCVNSVTYAPGLERLENETRVTKSETIN